MGFDTTIPGMSAEIVEPDIARPFGSAGKIAIVGKFERGDANTPYFYNNPRDALKYMGASKSYPGSNIITYAFKQDPDNSNYGASSIICVQAGARAKASLQLKDGSSANTLLLNAISGGLWANGATDGLTITVGTGTLNDQKLTVKLDGVVVETYDNCNVQQMVNKITAYSIYLSVGSYDASKTLATVTDQPLAGGTETSSPTTTDLNNALAQLLQEQFDILIFTDTPEDAYYPVVETWLNNKLKVDKPAMSILPIAAAKSVTLARSLVSTAADQLIEYIDQTFTLGTDVLSEAESAARYAAFIAGLAVNESATNKIISDITEITPTFGADDTYALTDGGVTVFELKSKENQEYGIVSAVTSSQDVDDTGKKKANSEQHAVRTLLFVINYMNLSNWLGRTGLSKTIPAIEGEVGNRIKDLVPDVADDVQATVSTDANTTDLGYVDLSVKAFGILKHIHTRIKLTS